MTNYYDPADKKYSRNIRKGAGPEFAAFAALGEAAGRADGAVPAKYRELMSLAVALTTQCVYCIEAHTQAAKRLGASEEEIAETAMITAAMRAGAAFAHGRMAMRFFLADGDSVEGVGGA